ncbi:MAG: family 43 glycosylhydrolase [Cytophagales bacterium]|nr:family 43 glycosylhydrolase [Armatimonadota bacterium]
MRSNFRGFLAGNDLRRLVALGLAVGFCAATPPRTHADTAAQKQKPATTAPVTYTNPVNDRNMPDPCVLWAEGAYWMTHTTGGPAVAWPLYRSADLVRWTFVKHLLEDAPTGLHNKPAWMKDLFWAPEIHQITPRQFVLTFTARSTITGHLSIGIATAASVTGPFVVQPTPLVSERVAVLDSHLFQDGDGKKYLYWKRDSPTRNGVDGAIFVQEMNAAATAFAPGSAAVVALQSSEADRSKDPAASWERGLVEAPWIVKQGNNYYLFYSGAFIDTSYALGVARAVSPMGPFTRCPGNPILRSSAVWGGPGHGAFITDALGTEFHLYHARRQENPKAGRVQLLDRLYWNGDWPAFGNGGTPSATPQPAPRPFRETLLAPQRRPELQ